jgi:acetylornithine deacetylase
MPKTLSCEQLLERLVGFDTTSDKPNRACIDFMRDYLDGFGVKSDIVATDDGTKACIWAVIGPKEKPGIVLGGHSDVVPVDGQNWTSDPFKLTARGGKFYGRGACDMKAFIACALSIVPELTTVPPKQPVHLAFTHDEETDMSGAVRLTDYMKKRNLKPAWVWIGEPTELHIIDAHKGVAAFSTDITGVPGHSSMPDKGQNAIETATDFMGILRRVAKARRDKPFPNSRFDPSFTTMNLGTIKGGTAENIIAEHCEVLWQVRAHPGDTAEAFRAEVDRLAATEIGPRFKAFAPHAGMKTCVCFDIPPLTPTADNPGEKILTRLTGHNQTEAVSFGTEAGFFQSLGTHVVVCGPGSIEQAHKADEFVAQTQLNSCVDVLRKVLISSAPA